MSDALEKLVDNLREKFRLKLGYDYAIMFTYGEHWLICRSAYKPSILEVAEAHGITFTIVRTE